MGKLSLRENEIKGLLNKYKSDLKELKIQGQALERTISALEETLKVAGQAYPVVAAKKGKKAKPKRRGRVAKSKSTALASTNNTPKRRGRPPKVKTATKAAAKVTPKRRGRPKKTETATVKTEVVAKVGKRRGRLPKVKTATEASTKATPKRRGRPPKAK